jgi:hypothetical protein
MDKSQMIQREKDQELKKKREIEVLKQKAIAKEKMRVTRFNSIVIIQKWTRGHLQRLQYAKM